MKSQCKTCVHNVTRQCMIFHTVIPADKESVYHDCPHWNDTDTDDARVILARHMDGHPDDLVGLWALQDMVAGDVLPPAGQRLEAYRLLFTAPYITAVERSVIGQSILPF